MAEETKNDLLLKRVQITIAILAGVATLVVGVYNVKKTVLAKSGPGNIELTVRSDDGPSVVGARAELYNAQNAIIAAFETGEDGFYKREGLEAGSYILKIRAKGFEPEAATVQVDQGRTADLVISLRPVPVAVVPVQPTGGPVAAQDAKSPTKIQSALEDVGASWIKKLAAGENNAADTATSVQ